MFVPFLEVPIQVAMNAGEARVDAVDLSRASDAEGSWFRDALVYYRQTVITDTRLECDAEVR